jgi:Apg6 BARA domain
LIESTKHQKDSEAQRGRNRVGSHSKPSADVCDDLSLSDDDFASLTKRLEVARRKKAEASLRRKSLAEESYDRRVLHDLMLERMNALSSELEVEKEESMSLKGELSRTKAHLEKLMRYNAINDVFHIWHSGPFGTINNFRLGTLPARPVEWAEINAAFGQAVLALAIVAERSNYEFKKYGLMPMGSFPKIYRVGDKRTVFTLFTDGSFSLFPKRRFNLALVGFLHCIEEMGAFVMRHDDTTLCDRRCRGENKQPAGDSGSRRRSVDTLFEIPSGGHQVDHCMGCQTL